MATTPFVPPSTDLDHSLEVERKFRNFGWALLGIWLSAIIYITRDFWFPDAFFAADLARLQQKGFTPRPGAVALPPIAIFDECSEGTRYGLEAEEEDEEASEASHKD